MLLRTISVETAEQTELNAALLCGFAIPASDRNFIAYSLNEQVVGPFRAFDYRYEHERKLRRTL